MTTILLHDWNLFGLALGVCTFLIIGVFHPIVIKSEYYYGTKSRWAFALAGVIMCLVSVTVESPFWSTLAGVVGFSCFWSIKEILEQRERVLKGWFPMNPKRAHEYTEKAEQESSAL